MFERVVRDDGGLSKAHTARHSSPTPLDCVIMSVVAIHDPSVPVLTRFPSGSMSVNLAFRLSDKTLKSSYVCMWILSNIAYNMYSLKKMGI